jgi:predicted transcriptional regulator YdeE
MVCVEVEKGTALPSGFVEVLVPDVKYGIYTHTGSMSAEQQTFDLICTFDDSVEPDEEKVHFERYDGRFEFLADSGSFDICIPIKPVAASKEKR